MGQNEKGRKTAIAVRFSCSGCFTVEVRSSSVVPASSEGKQYHGLVKTLGLDRVLHEVRLSNNGCDGEADRDGHAAEGLRVLSESLVAVAHVARVKIGIGAHKGEVKRVNTWL